MRTHVLFSGVIAIILASTFLTGCSKDIFYIHGTVQEEMDKAVENGFDGMIVYVNQGGNSSFYSAGFNNRENQIPADPHSLFKIASISKLYLAASATKLIANDQLLLDAKLSDLLPEVEGRVEYANEIVHCVENKQF